MIAPNISGQKAKTHDHGRGSGCSNSSNRGGCNCDFVEQKQSKRLAVFAVFAVLLFCCFAVCAAITVAASQNLSLDLGSH